MLDRVFRFVIASVGALLGFTTVNLLQHLEVISLSNKGWLSLAVHLGSSLILAIIFYLLSPKIINKGKKILKFIENEMKKIPFSEIVLGTIGLIIGLIIALLLSQSIDNFTKPFIGTLLASLLQLTLFIIFGYLGVKIATDKREDLKNVLNQLDIKKKDTKQINKKEVISKPKILDTSVIIDGRIADICKAGFVEGPLVIPEFVLTELQHIADSSDDMKRKRGRRGLDILQKMQKEIDIEIIIHDKKFEDIKEVDSKLLQLTKELNGKIITNDYNLNKVAGVQKIEVLNVNELANAVKPVVLPGEEMIVEVVRDGKEKGQGLAYLDDGTMIVVESGRKYIGKTIDVTVTSVLQTSAGKMIFGKPKALMNS